MTWWMWLIGSLGYVIVSSFVLVFVYKHEVYKNGPPDKHEPVMREYLRSKYDYSRFTHFADIPTKELEEAKEYAQNKIWQDHRSWGRFAACAAAILWPAVGATIAAICFFAILMDLLKFLIDLPFKQIDKRELAKKQNPVLLQEKISEYEKCLEEARKELAELVPQPFPSLVERD